MLKEKYNETQDLGLKWDLIKMEIRGFKYSKRKSKKYRDEEILLHKEVNDLQPDRKIILTETSKSNFKVLDHVSKKSCSRKPRVRF